MNFRHALGTALVLPAIAAAQQPAARKLSLADAVHVAATSSAVVASAALRTSQAEARVTQARSTLLPNISASALESGHTLNSATFGFNFPSQPGQPPILDPLGQVIGPVSTLDVRGQLTQTLFDAGAYQRYRASQASAAAVSTGQVIAAEQAAVQAAVAYTQALRADAQLSARLADSALAADLLGIAQARVQAGTGVALDVTRAEAQLAGVHAQLISARNVQARSQLALARALSLPLDTRFELTDSLGVGPLPDTTDLSAAVDAAVRSRPDVLELDGQMRAARMQVNATRNEWLPSLRLFGDDGAIGLRLNQMLVTYTWGLELSVPLFDGSKRTGRVSEQDAALRELQVRERDLRQQVAADVRGALLDLSSARQAVGAVREHVRLAEQEVSQARDRFTAGVAGNADVITASLSLNQARTQLIDAETAFQSARISLARAEGHAVALH
jgi:outer membrane protein TolC